MNEIFYLVSSFWLGAVHAATPGHGKTIAAAYIVGARGRPVDALVLGIFVTLSHTSGIVLVAALATFGSGWFLPHRIEFRVAKPLHQLLTQCPTEEQRLEAGGLHEARRTRACITGS